MGTTEECRAFFDKFDPEASAVSDPEAFFYDAFGLQQASAASFLAPGVFTSGLRAVMKGNLVGKPVGDVKQMPGQFLVENGTIVWKHVAEHVGDHPDLREVALRARGLEPPRG